MLYIAVRRCCSHKPIYPMMSSFRSSCGTLKLWSRESRTWRSFHKQNKNCSYRWRCKERINIYNAIFWLLYLIMGHIMLFLGASFFSMENNGIFWHRGSIKWFFNFSSYIAYTNTCKWSNSLHCNEARIHAPCNLCVTPANGIRLFKSTNFF